MNIFMVKGSQYKESRNWQILNETIHTYWILPYLPCDFLDIVTKILAFIRI